LINGNRYTHTNHRFQNLKVVLSCLSVLFHRVRIAIINPRDTGAIYPATEVFHIKGVIQHQRLIGIAILHLAGPSPITKGKVLRFLTASPL
jgi:hypothetical protein